MMTTFKIIPLRDNRCFDFAAEVKDECDEVVRWNEEFWGLRGNTAVRLSTEDNDDGERTTLYIRRKADRQTSENFWREIALSLQ